MTKKDKEKEKEDKDRKEREKREKKERDKREKEEKERREKDRKEQKKSTKRQKSLPAGDIPLVPRQEQPCSSRAEDVDDYDLAEPSTGPFGALKERFCSHLRTMVSQNRRRLDKHEFDLDLTYITDRIIAMGYPADATEAFYRNSMCTTVRFLETRHRGHYKVFNLRGQYCYDPAHFKNRVISFEMTDHHPPRLELMAPFCREVHEWLNENPANVVAVHCKAGKGRTGVMICAYLMYCMFYPSPRQIMDYYSIVRTRNNKGVTIPSQRRYVYYYSHLRDHQLNYVPPRVQLVGVYLERPPRSGGPILREKLSMRVSNGDVDVYYGDSMYISDDVWHAEERAWAHNATSSGPDSYDASNPTPGSDCISRRAYGWTVPESQPVFLEGDVRIDLYVQRYFIRIFTASARAKVGHIWFNTMFCCPAACGGTPYIHGDEAFPYPEGETSIAERRDKYEQPGCTRSMPTPAPVDIPPEMAAHMERETKRAAGEIVDNDSAPETSDEPGPSVPVQGSRSSYVPDDPLGTSDESSELRLGREPEICIYPSAEESARLLEPELGRENSKKSVPYSTSERSASDAQPCSSTSTPTTKAKGKSASMPDTSQTMKVEEKRLFADVIRKAFNKGNVDFLPSSPRPTGPPPTERSGVLPIEKLVIPSPPGLAKHSTEETMYKVYADKNRIPPRYAINQVIRDAHARNIVQDTYNERLKRIPTGGEPVAAAPDGRPDSSGPCRIIRKPTEHVSVFPLVEVDRAFKNNSMPSGFKLIVVTRCLDPQLSRHAEAFINITAEKQQKINIDNYNKSIRGKPFLEHVVERPLAEFGAGKTWPPVIQYGNMGMQGGGEAETLTEDVFISDPRAHNARLCRYFQKQRRDSISRYPDAEHHCPYRADIQENPDGITEEPAEVVRSSVASPLVGAQAAIGVNDDALIEANRQRNEDAVAIEVRGYHPDAITWDNNSGSSRSSSSSEDAPSERGSDEGVLVNGCP